MKYLIANEITNEIMLATGIRSFCADACLGTCCQSFHANCIASVDCLGELTCTSYLCELLRAAINKCAPDAAKSLVDWSASIYEALTPSLSFDQSNNRQNVFFESSYDQKQMLNIDLPDPPVLATKDVRAIRNMLEVVKFHVKQNRDAGCSGFGIIDAAFALFYGEKFWHQWVLGDMNSEQTKTMCVEEEYARRVG